MKVALIDADSLFYVLGWNMRERLEPLLQIASPDAPALHVGLDTDLAVEMFGAVDQAVIGILQATEADHYLGAIGDREKCFRYRIAKFKPYKGNRGESPDWFKLWKPVIEHRFREEWGFVSIPELEADDIISLAHEAFDGTQYTAIVCSPDKDMRQLPGRHFDYKKIDFADVSQEEAEYNLAYLMIAGDSSDGVAGIPGAGDKKAKEKLKEVKTNGLTFPDQTVRAMYYKHFGDHYGRIIYDENMAVLKLVTSQHPFYEVLTGYADRLESRPVPDHMKADAGTTDALKALGWG